jgi:hypothetical protein
MAVKVEKPTVSDVWITVFWQGKAELGAYSPATTRANDPSLTVFWCGETSRLRFRNAVERTARLFLEKDGYVQETLVGYGASREVIGPIRLDAKSQLRPGLEGCLSDDKSPVAQSSAYRAELEGTQGHVIIWANVAETVACELDQGGENIGICMSPAMFGGPARTLVADMIEETRLGAQPATRRLGHEVVDGLLDEIAEAVKKNVGTTTV